MPWALYFAQEGYRVVLVDCRGHGRSTGHRIGFGAWEADDFTRVVDELEQRGLLAGKLGVFGQSYGASMSIHWAARDPRVTTVVALAPFADPQKAIAEFARGLNPKLTNRLSDATFDSATAKAAKLAAINWTDLNVTAAMSRVHVPILIFHGTHDTWIPPLHSETLAASAPLGSRREVTPDDDHMSLMFRFDLIGPQALRWFEQWLLEPRVDHSHVSENR